MCERSLLGTSFDLCARLEVAGGNPLGRRLEASHRAGDRTRDHSTRDQPDEQHCKPDRREIEHDVAHRAVGRLDALRHSYRARDLSVPEDRSGCREDPLVERSTAARELPRLPRQGISDLGTIERLAEHGRMRTVGEYACMAVNHDHPAPHRARNSLDERLQTHAVCRTDQVGRGRREHVGVVASLGMDLGMHAATQAERQRHFERDDREDEHIGNSEDDSRPEGQCGNSSGPLKRNPTPRTVCR